MSNYPNMSYCMCENTVGALYQVLNAMREEGADFFKEMSREERRAYQDLFQACEAFIDQAGELEAEFQEVLVDEY